MKDETKFGGVFTLKHVRDGKVIDEQEISNIVVDEGLKYLLDTAMGGTTQSTSWYLSIFENNYVPASADIGADIASVGKCGAFTGYTEATRPPYSPALATNAPVTLTNSATKANFSINTSTTIYGAFLINTSAKDGTGDAASKLMAGAQFSTPRAVAQDDVLLVTYEFVASSA